MNKNMKKNDSSSFQTVWKVGRGSEGTNTDSASARGAIRFRTTGSFTIDWGDGCVEKVKGSTSGLKQLKHQYVNAGVGAIGIYTVSISGAIKHFSVGQGSYQELIEIKQWGAAQWESMYSMFGNACNMTCSATDTPDTSKVENMSFVFSGCKKFNSPIEHWDTKGVKTMNHMLHGARMFNRSLANMDISSVKDTSCMLEDTPAFDQDMRGLNIGAKTDTDYLFGWRESLAQYNEEHGERFDAEYEKQEVYNVLKNKTFITC